MIDRDNASNEPIDEAVQAAKDMVTTLLGTGDNRVAVVCFAYRATKLADFTEAAGKDALLTTLDRLDGSTIAGDGLGAGTHTQAGLHVARATLGGARSDVAKTVILLTDGMANDRYKCPGCASGGCRTCRRDAQAQSRAGIMN